MTRIVNFTQIILVKDGVLVNAILKRIWNEKQTRLDSECRLLDATVTCISNQDKNN